MTTAPGFVPLTVPALETDRLVLRCYRDDDLDGMSSIYSDENHARFLGGTAPRHECWKRIMVHLGHWHTRGWGRFALEEKTTGKFVGHCGPAMPASWPEPEIQYSLTPEAVGKGYATEAARRALQHAYEDLGWTTAMSLIADENEASKNVARKLGGHREKTVTILENFKIPMWRFPSPRKFLEKFGGKK